MTTFEPTERTRVRLRRERGVYNREVINDILDEALVCNIATVIDGLPYVIPTAIVRIDDYVYIHGSRANRMLAALEKGAPACIAVTLIDSLVAGRSGFGCSMDYRSVMIFAQAERIPETEDKTKLIETFVQGIIPGHKVRPPKPNELAATLFLKFSVNEASAKIREVGNLDVDGDYELDLWAGVIPLALVAGVGRPCPQLKAGIEVPPYARKFRRTGISTID